MCSFLGYKRFIFEVRKRLKTVTDINIYALLSFDSSCRKTKLFYIFCHRVSKKFSSLLPLVTSPTPLPAHPCFSPSLNFLQNATELQFFRVNRYLSDLSDATVRYCASQFADIWSPSTSIYCRLHEHVKLFSDTKLIFLTDCSSK